MVKRNRDIEQAYEGCDPFESLAKCHGLSSVGVADIIITRERKIRMITAAEHYGTQIYRRFRICVTIGDKAFFWCSMPETPKFPAQIP